MPSDEPTDINPAQTIAALRKRIIELENLVEDRAQMLRLVLDHIPLSVFWKDRQLAYLGANQHFADDASLASPDDLIGKTDYQMPWVEQAELYRSDDMRVMESGESVLNYEEPQSQADGSTIWVRTSKVPLRDTNGHVVGILGMYEDITNAKHSEEERIRLQEEIIRVQAAAIDELSTPLIPLSPSVVAIPLIGSIDTRRAQQVLETLLTGISQSSAEYAILDITGVPVVDTQVANALIHAATAVKLLGAQVILTGIRPEVAQTLVSLGMQFDRLVTRSTLQSGIAYARERGAL
ncbi:MAG: PAS domain-containing protein [Oscillochloris sp.]|nr:PAS domain-containing protein [Oscillochloris sp.]